MAPSGKVTFGWDGYTGSGGAKGPVNLYVTESTDGGRTWAATQLDTSGAPPDCAATYACGWAYLGAQLTIASDAAGTVFALWNAGSVAFGPERMYFASKGASASAWSAKVEVSTAPAGTAHSFPAIAAAGTGDVRIAWMDARAASGAWNTWYRESTNGGRSWSSETAVSSFVNGLSYVHPDGYDFPFGDYFELRHRRRRRHPRRLGRGRELDAPGSVWYARGR